MTIKFDSDLLDLKNFATFLQIFNIPALRKPGWRAIFNIFQITIIVNKNKIKNTKNLIYKFKTYWRLIC